MSTCALCGTSLDAATVVGTRGRYSPELINVCCSTCGLVQQRPRPSQADLDAWYASGAYRAERDPLPMRHSSGALVMPGSPEYDEARLGLGRNRAALIVEALGLTADDDVLEIGCADGHVASGLGERDIGVWGWEPDETQREKALERGVLVLDEAPVVEGYGEFFNAIYSLHVVEHYADPVAELAKLRTLLRPGGKLFLECPNVLMPYGDLDDWFFEAAHVTSFSVQTLIAVARRVGFKPIWVRETLSLFVGFGMCDPDPDYMPGQPASEVVATLSEYRETSAARQAQESAAEVARAFVDGASVAELGEGGEALLRDAIKLLGAQGFAAMQAYNRCMHDIGAMCELLDREVSVAADEWHKDSWQWGRVCGRAELAAQAGHMLGHAANAWKLLDR